MKACKHKVTHGRKVALDGRQLGRLDVARRPPYLTPLSKAHKVVNSKVQDV